MQDIHVGELSQPLAIARGSLGACIVFHTVKLSKYSIFRQLVVAHLDRRHFLACMSLESFLFTCSFALQIQKHKHFCLA